MWEKTTIKINARRGALNFKCKPSAQYALRFDVTYHVRDTEAADLRTVAAATDRGNTVYCL